MSSVTLAERKLSIHALSQSLFLPRELPQVYISDLQDHFQRDGTVQTQCMMGLFGFSIIRTYKENEIRVPQVSAELELVQVRSRLLNEVSDGLGSPPFYWWVNLMNIQVKYEINNKTVFAQRTLSLFYEDYDCIVALFSG